MGLIENTLSVQECKDIMKTIDLDQDGVITAKELYQTTTGLVSECVEMESLVMQLLDDTVIDRAAMTFPDFLIFMCQRRRQTCPVQSNPIRELFQV